ncbi:unnamed protein product [Meganyctiphanes norvegica]|uniref:ShKT domain-containing protein n=1 Tax=Meganyctiphanes norvegica TaxID=48144 RepID=A0AAV2Q5W2_MEGNR
MGFKFSYLPLGILVNLNIQLSSPVIADILDSHCNDKDNSCPYWASVGGCEKNPGYMLPNCPDSCNQCDIPLENSKPHLPPPPASSHYTTISAADNEGEEDEQQIMIISVSVAALVIVVIIAVAVGICLRRLRNNENQHSDIQLENRSHVTNVGLGIRHDSENSLYESYTNETNATTERGSKHNSDNSLYESYSKDVVSPVNHPMYR